MAIAGKVKWFDEKKGFGFIDAVDGGGDVFVHFGDIVGEGRQVLGPDDKVEFDIGETPYGRRALKVRRVE